MPDILQRTSGSVPSAMAESRVHQAIKCPGVHDSHASKAEAPTGGTTALASAKSWSLVV